jgi:hypothetical protein
MELRPQRGNRLRRVLFRHLSLIHRGHSVGRHRCLDQEGDQQDPDHHRRREQ